MATETVAASSDGRARELRTSVELEGRRFDVTVLAPEPPHAELARRRRDRMRRGGAGAAGQEAVVSPMPGTVLAVEVAEGEAVVAGQVLLVVEAMKMENEIAAHRDGVVRDLAVSPGQPVTSGQVLCVVAQADGAS